MERKWLTCPISAHLEQIELEHTVFGVVVARCSRFGESPVDCSHECARRLDVRDHDLLREFAERVLVLYGTSLYSRALAEMLAHCLQSDCLVAELANSALRSTPPPEDYDAVVFVSPIRSGRHAPSIAEYLSAHHLALATMPTFFVEPNRESVVHVSELAKAIGDEIPALLT